MLNILYVDDEPALLDLGKRFLERYGDISVYSAESAHNALSILKNTDIDVIISDYDMPEMNGIEFLKTLRDFDNQIPFIIFTGKGREEIVIQAIDEGADSYIQKTGESGVLFQHLRQKIDKVIRLKIAEKEVRRKSREWDGIFNSTERTTLILNTSQEIISANRASILLLGKNENELLGKKYLSFFSHNNFQSTPFFKVLSSKTYQSIVLKSDMLEKTFDISYTPVLDEAGEVEKIIFMASDISQRIRVEEELRKYRENLEELVRERTIELAKAKELAESSNKAKTTFLSNMSHELRTPLNAILGYTQVLQRYDNITVDQKEQLKTIYSSGKHLLSLINDLLDLSKIEAQALQIDEKSFNLMSLFKEVFNITKIKADEKNLSFTFETLSPVPTCVSGDEGKLKQILINLLNNAIKYTESGEVRFRVRYGFPENHQLYCEIVDTGKGIPDDKKEVIFKPFTQIGAYQENAEGTGLGLAITKNLVEFMHGTLDLESVPGQGSVFSIMIPFPPSLAYIPEHKEIKNIIGYEGERKKVLIVDDNISNASFLDAFLRPLEFIILRATNGPDAIQIATNDHPDIILLDFVMSGMDGLEVIHQIRKNPELDDMKIIGISASVSKKEFKNDFKLSCDEFLVKPVDINILLNVLGHHLNIVWKEKLSDTPIELKENISPSSKEIRIPPVEILNKIELLAKQGNFTRVNQILIQLEKENTADNSFILKIRHNCLTFNDDAIIAYIRSLKK